MFIGNDATEIYAVGCRVRQAFARWALLGMLNTHIQRSEVWQRRRLYSCTFALGGGGGKYHVITLSKRINKEAFGLCTNFAIFPTIIVSGGCGGGGGGVHFQSNHIQLQYVLSIHHPFLNSSSPSFFASEKTMVSSPSIAQSVSPQFP